MRAVLMERGLWRHGLKHKCVKPKNDPRFEGHPCQGRNDCCATAILDAQSDFQEQECRIARIVKEASHLCLFLPKYHCELNIIEFFWGITKRYVRENCSFKFEDLENRVYEGMALTSKLTMRKWYFRMWRWIKAYSCETWRHPQVRLVGYVVHRTRSEGFGIQDSIGLAQ